MTKIRPYDEMSTNQLPSSIKITFGTTEIRNGFLTLPTIQHLRRLDAKKIIIKAEQKAMDTPKFKGEVLDGSDPNDLISIFTTPFIYKSSEEADESMIDLLKKVRQLALQ